MDVNQLCKLAEIGTCLATISLAVIAWSQIRQLTTQATTSFEDSLTEQYRRIMEDIPADIWLGSGLEVLRDERQREQCRDAIYRYIDLSNEQAFLHHEGRIRSETWTKWKEGIEFNMKLSAFEDVWREVASKAPKNFEFLRDMIP